MRAADDQFAQALYQTVRRAFSRNLREALEAKEAVHADKVDVPQVCLLLCKTVNVGVSPTPHVRGRGGVYISCNV